MKKIGLIFMIMLFAGTMVQAQQPQQRNNPRSGYFQQTVIPFVEKQQAKLEQALTPAEKQELQKIREEMAVFRKQGAQMRKAMQGHFNQQAWDARKAQFEAIVAKARKLAEAHPAAAEAYKKAVEEKMQQMPAMAGNRMGAQGGGHGMMGKNPQAKMKKLSDPAFGLLMNFKAMQGMRAHHPQGMKGNRGAAGYGKRMPGNRTMGNSGAISHAVMMAMRQPAVQEKIRAYRVKNILPVMKKQREAFDKLLSNKEKKEIARARNDMKALRDQRLKMRKEGMRPSDSARLAMQLQMDKDRVAIRGIALKHYGELQKTLAPIKEKMPQWRRDIRKIVAEYVVEQQMQHLSKTFGKKIHPFLKEKGEMMFLLMDPAHPDDNGLMPLFGANPGR